MKKSEFTEKAIRHGEVMITPIDELPESAEQVFSGREYIVGHSESGHHHVAIAEGITIYKPIGADSQELFMKVTAPGRIEHRKAGSDRHEAKTLLPGLYTVTIKRAYNYFKKVMEKGVD
jgi:hypothetical protein